jgi:APA family basic amino acid/polyamine antiporter
MVVVKLIVVLVVIFAGIKFINPANYSPFIPPQEGGKFGFQGIIKGAASVFFAYIGFDSVSTVAQEAKNPQKDLPIGIVGSLLICTVIYIAVCVVITGMVNYKDIDVSAPIAVAFQETGMPWLVLFIDVGALAGLTSVILNLMIGQPRIFQSMAADGLFPRSFGQVSAKRGTPYVATLTTGIVCAIFASLLPVDFLANLTSVGTLFAFSFVSLSVIFLRITDPDLPRAFKVPGIYKDFGGFFIPFLNLLGCIYLLANQSLQNAIRVLIWMLLGLVMYAFYGYRNSKLQQKMDRLESETQHILPEKKLYA